MGIIFLRIKRKVKSVVMNISRSGSCKVKASKMILSSINVTEPVFDIEHYQLMILDTCNG
jgi:hypothetical protein